MGETSQDRGLTIKQLRKQITKRCLYGIEQAVGTIEIKDLPKFNPVPEPIIPQRRAEDKYNIINTGSAVSGTPEILIGLEGVLALISEFEEEFPKPKFTINSDNGTIKNIYLRKDISQLKGVKIGVISALNSNELSQMVKQLNENHGMRIVREISRNAEHFKIENENIVYADCADNNAYIAERLNNLKVLKRERFIEIKWFSCENMGDKGLTLVELKKELKKYSK